MFIENAFKAKYNSWRYVLGVLLTFLISQVGGIFLIVFVTKKLLADGQGLEALADPSTLMTTLDSNFTLFLMLLGFLLGLVALFLFVKYVHKQKIKDLTTTRAKVDFKRIGIGFLLVAIPSLVLLGIGLYSNPEDYVLQFDLYPFFILLVIAVVFIPIQTSFEEYLFRGYLMQGIGVNANSKAIALVVTSLIFGMLHVFNPEVEKLGYLIMVYYIGTGLFLGIITLMDEGMELALGYHAGNNLLAALLVTTDWTVFRTHAIFKDISEPSIGFEALGSVLVFMPICYFILAKKYKWTGFREKIFGKPQKNEEIEIL